MKKEFLSQIPNSPTGASVVNGDLSFAIRMWKKRLKESGNMQELYKRKYYKKPSTQRRETKLDAIYRRQKEMETNN